MYTQQYYITINYKKCVYRYLNFKFRPCHPFYAYPPPTAWQVALTLKKNTCVYIYIYMKKTLKTYKVPTSSTSHVHPFLVPPLGAHELVVLCVGSWRRCMRNDGGRFRSVLKHNLTWMWWLGLSYKSLFLDILIVMSSVSRCTVYRILGSAKFTSTTTFTTTYSLGLWNQSKRFRSEKENHFLFLYFF